MAAFILVLALTLTIYTYFVYPILLALFSKFLAKPVASDPGFEPAVTLIIAAYNEALVIAAKLENCLAIDYPRDKLQIIVASDGSDDGTNAIVATFAERGIELNALSRGGKTRALNATVPLARHDIVVFSDSNAMFEPQALHQLTRHFADTQVGAVSGDVRLVNDNDEFNASEGLYYRYERAIQAWESALHGMIGVDGAMYAIRRELYRPPSGDIICDDFVISMNILREGHRVIYCPEAVATEDSVPTMQQELKRRSRYIAATTHALLKREGLPGKGQWLGWWMYVSHKLLRWLVPVFLILVLVANLYLLSSAPGALLFCGQLTFYGLAIAGFLKRAKPMPTAFRVPYYFCLQNVGAMMGLVRGPLRMQEAAWTSPDRTLVETEIAPKEPAASDAEAK